MAFIGNTVQNQGFTPAIDYFNGNGVTVTFTLSRPIASVAQVIVAVDNVIQNPSSAFGVVGNSITFTSAPLSGTNNIWVEYTSLITTYQGISQDPTVIGDIRATGGYLAEGDFGNSFIDGAILDYVTGAGRITVGELDNLIFYHGGTAGRSVMMDLYYAGGAKVYGTTALTIPVGTTGERPGTPANGMIRMNTTTGYPEWYDTTTSNWVQFNQSKPFLLDYLVIAGGGGGGRAPGGGGGAGGYRTSAGTTGGGGAAESQLVITPGTSYTVTVGDGGLGSTTNSVAGASGSNSVFSTITSTGGGGGGSRVTGTSTSQINGQTGGSGGGGSLFASAPQAGGTAGARTASPVQGFNGGIQTGTGSSDYGCGGGGGAGAVGDNASGSPIATGGNGGAGLSSSITGSAVTRAGGGGGGGYGSAGGSGGTGGSGIGGNGTNSSSTGGAGSTNTGSGGGGGGISDGGNFGSGGNGGSGVVIIKYPDTFTISNAGGGLTFTTSTAGGFKVTTFTAGTGSVVFA